MKYLSVLSILVTALLFAACGEGARPSAHSQLAPAAAPKGVVHAAVVEDKSTTKPAPKTQPAATADKAVKASQHVAELNQKIIKLFERKEYTQCKQALNELLAIDPKDNNAWYNMACAQSRLNEPQAAVESLNKAVEYGFFSIQHMERDTDLDAIRKLAGYKEIIARREEIQRQHAKRIEAQLRSEAGSEYICEIDNAHRIVFATSTNKATLDEVKQRLTVQASALWAQLFSSKPDEYLTVVILSDKDSAKLPMQLGGYYQDSTKQLTTKQIGSTLVHEFTHALHAGDANARGQTHRIWVMEGLATLMETADFSGPTIKPQDNFRLNSMQAILKVGRSIPFKTFFNLTPESYVAPGKAEICYSQGRYIMMYLYQQGKLKQWYDTYCQMYSADPSGEKATEKVLGKKLDKIEADWKTWVAALKAPPMTVNKAYIGIRLGLAADGIKVVSVLPGSGAAEAGLKEGDIVLKVDGQRVIDNETLVGLVAQKEADAVVPVEFRRNGLTRTLDVTLKAVPVTTRRRPTSQPTTSPTTRKTSPPIHRPRTTQPAVPT